MQERVCVCGFKKDFDFQREDVAKSGPLNVVVSRKSTDEKCLHDLSVMDGSCVFRIFRKQSNSASECCQTPQISSK